MTRSLLAALFSVVLVGPALADPGHGHGGQRAYGVPGDPARTSRVVEVVMSDADGRMRFEPDRVEVRRGDQIRFVLRNTGVLDHELVLATLEDNLKHAEVMRKHPDMEHDDPNARRLMPGASGEILWKFTKAGTFDFSCLIPGHREAGMTGTIIVK
ncbi:cupredoxin family protein [Xanthobacter sp. KR7-65]|uniref:cupredoxin domain-containing protein n=1 Tax=Xanthobacter sp. KR7-65 TaxID=3156612 RepID=UPI0032B53438